MSKKVIVIGGGIAGMEASAYLATMGYDVTLLEKKAYLGGHLVKWEKLFPTKRLGKEVLDFLMERVSQRVNIILNTNIVNAERIGNKFKITLSDGSFFNSDAILIASGYDLFDARKKEEYGYGIYDNVITSADLEEMFLYNKEIKTSTGKTPQRIGFVHCVGSRDEKAGNIYCSKVCCVTAVKQSVELKEKLPEAEIFCFYMDMRMYGRHFEELYKESQEKFSVNYIRGRLSEAAENADASIVVKVEDTLIGRPLKMTVDILVLLVGFVPSEGTKNIGTMLGIDFDEDGFIKNNDEHTMTNVSNVPGIFLAGTCTGPRTITNTITDARAAAAEIANYLENSKLHNTFFR
ncbi:MAG: CoB--CoM heterodisulfide reductase iron-sulfur subunit A family protein [Bacteroidales bacterium]|nr:CoB--CoM heterodisulfide reductase iron-sulfur subunit A family protein [Bacteroidales bacterium]